MLTSLVSFIIVLGVLIFVHELGHFLVAKRSGVGVLKFSLGFGPKLFGIKRGETEYLISVFPLGGYVKMVGDDPSEELPEEDRAKAFNHKSVGIRTAIVFAGPFANFLLAWLIFTLILAIGLAIPIPRIDSALPNINTVVAGSPAEEAGIQSGDRVRSIDGVTVDTWDEMTKIVRKSPDKKLHFVIERDGKMVETDVTPKAKPDDKEPVGQIGVSSQALVGAVIKADNILMSPILGVQAVWEWCGVIVESVKKLVTAEVSAKNIGGPVLIAQQAGAQAKEGVLPLIMFMAVISVNLGILNLLPIPVLDGGHLFFFMIEALIGKPLDIKHREIAQQIGLVLLLALMVFAFYNDIVRVVTQR